MQGSGAVGVDVRTGAREWTARAIFPSELPMEWSILAGEIIYNVRTALDHLAWQVVLRCGGQPTRQTAFPIFADEDSFDESSQRMLAGMSEEARVLIRALQPFVTGRDHPQMETLWVLHELHNIDKHRVLHLPELYLTSASYLFEGPADAEVETVVRLDRGPLTSGAPMAHFRFGGAAPVTVRFAFSFDVTLKERGAEGGSALPAGFTLVETLRQLIGRVQVSILHVLDQSLFAQAFGSLYPALEDLDIATEGRGVPIEQRHRRKFDFVVTKATIPTVTLTGGCTHWRLENVTPTGYDLVHSGSGHIGYEIPTVTADAAP